MSSRVAVFIDPVSHHFDGDGLFDEDDPYLNRDDAIAAYAHLRRWLEERGVTVHTADRLASGEVAADVNLYVSMGVRDRWRGLADRDDVILSAFFALECPVVEPAVYRDLTRLQHHFRRIFSYSDADALSPFLAGPVTLEHYLVPYAHERVNPDLWAREDRDFLVMINRNKRPRDRTAELYTERLRAVEFFERTGEIDLYGQGWDDVPYQMGETFVPHVVRRVLRAAERQWRRVRPDPLLAAAARAHAGPLDAKLPTLARYRYAICFENMVLPGWITEKLFDCLVTGTVPVYLGAPDITDYVPPDCFIDMRRFAGYPELREYLHSLSAADVDAYRDNARRYLESEAFRPFTRHGLVDTFATIVEEDAGLALREPRGPA